jgi:hypothetical protein
MHLAMKCQFFRSRNSYQRLSKVTKRMYSSGTLSQLVSKAYCMGYCIWQCLVWISNVKVGKEKGANLREMLISHVHEMIAYQGFGPTSKAFAKLEDDVVGCGHVCQILPFMSDQKSFTDEAIRQEPPSSDPI